MARPTFLPLTKSIVIADEEAGGVHFTDLAGSTVNATYVQVVPSTKVPGSWGQEKYFIVEPSGLITQSYDPTTVATSSTNASACLIGVCANPMVELSLGYKSTVSSIKISNQMGESTTFVVTYGHIKNSPAITDARILVDGSY